MYVRKFHGDSLDEALAAVKLELGPDAIILKTVTNKGLKGAFKKNKYEITAAISEQNYIKKAKVDQVLTEEQKKSFYLSDAKHASQMISSYNGDKKMQPQNYGNLGLNKAVSSAKNAVEVIKTPAQKAASNISSRLSLDDFLSSSSSEYSEEIDASMSDMTNSDYDSFLANETDDSSHNNEALKARLDDDVYTNTTKDISSDYKRALEQQEAKIKELERKLEALVIENDAGSEQRYDGIKQLRSSLKTLDVDEIIIRKIVNKCLEQLNKQQQANADLVFELALTELHKCIKVMNPSVLQSASESISLLLSETGSGQTSMALKLAANHPNVVLVSYCSNKRVDSKSFTAKVLNINLVECQNLAELVNACRNAISTGKSVIVDFKIDQKKQDETKSVIDALKRSFRNIEILINISAIQSELYNKKVATRYAMLADGIVVNHLDLCLNFAALINIQMSCQDLPFAIFGTGETVPDDFELATSERLLAGMFEL
jgi:flagellar biosynthesis GTPase FlhF